MIGSDIIDSIERLIEFCVEHMSSEEWPKEQVRAHMEAVVPGLSPMQKNTAK